MDYRKLIKEEIAKWSTDKGAKVNPKLDSNLGEEIVASICRRIVKNCRIANVSRQREQCNHKFERVEKGGEFQGNQCDCGEWEDLT